VLFVLAFHAWTSSPEAADALGSVDLGGAAVSPSGYSISLPVYQPFPWLYSSDESVGTILAVIRREGTDLPAGLVDYLIASTDGSSDDTNPDFAEKSGTIQFAQGEPERILPLRVIDDSLSEGLSERFRISLQNPQGATPLGTPASIELQLIDNDLLGYNPSAPFSVSESAGEIRVSVFRSGPNVGRTTLDYTTLASAFDPAAPGQDFVAVSGTLVFEDNDLSKTFTIPLINDPESESPEGIAISFTAPRFPPSIIWGNPIQVFIEDDDLFGFFLSHPFSRAAESSGQLRVVVGRTGSNLPPATVDYSAFAAQPLAAMPGADFQPVSGTLAFAAGEIEQSFTIPLLDDKLYEDIEAVGVVLSNPSGGANLTHPSSADYYIEEDDIGFHIITHDGTPTTSSIVESAGGISLVVRRVNGDLRPAAVTYAAIRQTFEPSATPGRDFEAISGRFVFALGETQKTLFVPVTDDGLSEETEYFRVELKAADGYTPLADAPWFSLSILDDDLGYVIDGFAPSTDTAYGPFRAKEGETIIAISISRITDLSETSTVDLRVAGLDPADPLPSATAGLDFSGGNQTVHFQQGQTNARIRIQLHADAIPEDEEFFRAILFNPSHGLRVPAEPARFSLLDAALEPVHLDPAFQPAYPPSFGSFDPPYPPAILPDGKTLLLTQLFSITGEHASRLIRLLPDGATDPSFAPQDIVAFSALLPLADGSLLVGGGAIPSQFTLNREPFHLLARLRPDGTRDPAFSVPGSLPLGIISALATNSSGQIAAAGRATNGINHLFWLNADGSATTNPPLALPYRTTQLYPQPGGGLVARLHSSNPQTGQTRSWLARFLPDGTPDPTFPILPERENLRAAEPLSDGRWAVLVRYFDSAAATFADEIHLLLPNGEKDPAFKPFKALAGYNIAAFGARGGELWFLRGQANHSSLLFQVPSGAVEAQTLGLLDCHFSSISGSPALIFAQSPNRLLLHGAYLVQGRLQPLFSRLDLLAPSPRLELAPQSARLAENAGQAPIHLLRTGDLSKSLTLLFSAEDGTAHSDRDYRLPNGQLFFFPGQSSASTFVALYDNSEINEDRSFTLRFNGAPTLQRDPIEITIVNDDLGFVPGALQPLPGGGLRARVTGHLPPLDGQTWPSFQASINLNTWLPRQQLAPWTSEIILLPNAFTISPEPLAAPPAAFWRILRP